MDTEMSRIDRLLFYLHIYSWQCENPRDCSGKRISKFRSVLPFWSQRSRQKTSSKTMKTRQWQSSASFVCSYTGRRLSRCQPRAQVAAGGIARLTDVNILWTAVLYCDEVTHNSRCQISSRERWEAQPMMSSSAEAAAIIHLQLKKWSNDFRLMYCIEDSNLNNFYKS